MAHQPQLQNIPVQVYRSQNHIVVAAPMPGLQAKDILVTIAGDRVTIAGQERGPHEPMRDLLVSEWAVGPYYRELTLPQPVNGALANATYGNGVLVLSIPRLEPEHQDAPAEFKLDVTEATRGERIGHTGQQHPRP